ncbi:MAG: hypothetical protein HC904_03315 [Blastochloris sp.]|nr:hypothetical protein [Blastochloris sp.]
MPELQVELRPGAVEKVLGYELSEERVESILRALGCVRQPGGMVFRIPPHRPDLQREIDLIEELSRIEGMERVRGSLSRGVAATSEADAQYDREWELRRLLSALGYAEWMTNSLRPRTEASEETIALLNPLTEDYALLRGSLLETVLPCVRHNLSRGAESVKAFEIGTVYRAVKGRPVEEKRLVLLGAGVDRAAHWSEAERLYDYYSLRGVMEAVRRKFPEFVFRIRVRCRKRMPGHMESRCQFFMLRRP